LRESELEKKLKTEIRKRKGLALKFLSPGNAGVPDRLVLLPGGNSFFVELKAPGKKPRELQKEWLSKLRRVGFRALVVASEEELIDLLEEIDCMLGNDSRYGGDPFHG